MNNFDFALALQILMYFLMLVNFITLITEKPSLIRGSIEFLLVCFVFLIYAFFQEYKDVKSFSLVLISVIYLIYIGFGIFYSMSKKIEQNDDSKIIKLNLLSILLICICELIFIKIQYHSWYGVWFLCAPIIILFLCVIVLAMSSPDFDRYE